jgi:hypothetical protein
MRKLPEDISNSEAVVLGIQLLEDVQLTGGRFYTSLAAFTTCVITMSLSLPPKTRKLDNIMLFDTSTNMFPLNSNRK